MNQKLSGGVCAAVAPQWLQYFIDIDALEKEAEIFVYGFDVTAADSAGEINMSTVIRSRSRA